MGRLHTRVVLAFAAVLVATLPGRVATQTVPPHTVLTIHPGSAGYPLNPMLDEASASPVPVYGTSELYVGAGVTGGVIRTNAETGRRLGESQLPPGSIVSFREPSLWRDYWREVLTGLAVLALQSLLIIGLLYQRRARRKAEVESRNTLALAADANRRVTLSALSGSIAHELAQPLSSILLNAQAGEMLVDSNRATPETVREILSEIHTADVQAMEIVERYRNVPRTQPLEKQPIDVHSVVRESLALVARDTRANQVQVDLDLETAPCVVDGDPVLLEQVLVNLVMNAMQAMADTPRARRRVTVLSRLNKGSVEVSVRDSGTGLPSPVGGRLFEPFVTTKTNGMGIGLTIARSIAEAHGGTMAAHNNPEGGATFTLTLPCVQTGRAGSSAAARRS